LKVSVAHSFFVHKTYTKLIHNRPPIVVIACNLFGSVMGVLCILCSIVSVLWSDMYVSLFNTNYVEVLNTFTQHRFEA